MLTGKVFDGVEAQQLRLVNKAVPTDRVVDEAMQIATEMASAVVDAVRGILTTLRAKQDAGLDIRIAERGRRTGALVRVSRLRRRSAGHRREASAAVRRLRALQPAVINRCPATTRPRTRTLRVATMRT
ncbi:hypothetical protein PINS_up023006 [Pythium insidiosum]|nr:hypothetical protein PINS_up023006 [Pythium insidiosum]